MKQQNPLKQNPVKADDQFQRSKRYFTMKRQFIGLDLGNTQETQKLS